MSNSNTSKLVELILNLTKSEKRNFQLSAKKTKHQQLLYLELYGFIERYKKYDEKSILVKIPKIKKGQLSNLKANLYKQILRSLRDIHKENYLEIKAREQFDFAKVLYAKGMYNSSLEMLQKVKELARRIHKQPIEYLAISFEKHIESQHVTGSMSPKAISLSQESEEILENLTITDQLSNLALLMYGKYLQLGIVRSEREQNELSIFFQSHLPSLLTEMMDYNQKKYFFQSYVWYYMMTQDFARYFLYAQRWVDLYVSHPEMQKVETVIYIKGLHNVLNALYLSNKKIRFEEKLIEFKNFNYDGRFNLSVNEQTQLDLFQNIHILNLIFFKANYIEGVCEIQDFANDLLENPERYDLNRRIVFHYKIACVYFGANQLDKTIIHLNKITNQYIPQLKEDIQCFARILKLITHFDMGDEMLVFYDVKSVYRFLLKMRELQAPQREILKFIRKTPSINADSIIDEFVLLRNRLIPLEKVLLERRPFLYLDIISWLDSKINRKDIAVAIKERRIQKVQSVLGRLK